ncbi:S1 RNA-binding domain-containing protein [Syntrophomonas palmitatica]|uniref:S1 RNA-binding domain-containing protein n=1 Tax=Syntrophomonas palmitatica TaxID=402877 RepID=UPI0006D2B7E4|nr:S1 RNA-binding domain-containing protein [Syntrophomonas palmitatica]
MPIEQSNIVPGDILEGTVQGITKFGAFVELPGGAVGLVHISEIADTYVRDVKDFIKEGDKVTVKVLNVAGKKVGLSIKQAAPKPAPVSRKPENSHYNSPRDNYSGASNSKPKDLDDMITRFLKESDERMQPLKQKMEPRRRNRNA